MKEAALFLYLAAVMAIGIRAKATTLEKFILGDRLGTRAMVATIVSTFYTLAALTGRKLREDTALFSLLGGALSSLAWKIAQPLKVDALFIGLGFSLLVVMASEAFQGRRRAQ